MNKVVNKMFSLLLYETVFHITHSVLIDRKTIKRFVNEYDLKIKCLLKIYHFFETFIHIMLFFCYFL